MTPTWEIREGHVLDRLAEMPDESVHCVVTSPPYWGLRDYGTGEWVGGDAECDHVAGIPRQDHSHGDRLSSRGTQGSAAASAPPQLQACSKCGAERVDQQIGLEATPEEYVEKLVEVFREVRRVLRPDGTLWLNLGDRYASTKGKSGYSNTGSDLGWSNAQSSATPQNLKPKDLVGIPWRVAFALQEDGWWLRSDIIWSKTNPMPESVRDRPTKAHEYIFLLTKSNRYFYDPDAITEPATYGHEAKWDNGEDGYGGGASHAGQGSSTRKFRRGSGNIERKYGEDADRPGSDLGRSVPWIGVVRNKRTVWTIPTRPFPEAHFAVFPIEIPEICIKAGCPEGGIVLDPFAGAGTTILAAARLGRSGIGIELNPEYAEMARRRIDHDCPLFNREMQEATHD